MKKILIGLIALISLDGVSVVYADYAEQTVSLPVLQNEVVATRTASSGVITLACKTESGIDNYESTRQSFAGVGKDEDQMLSAFGYTKRSFDEHCASNETL
jgi:hypothetical protein